MDIRSKIAAKIKKISKIYFKNKNRKYISAKYLKGNGIEIGALHNPLKVSSAAQVKFVDRLSKDELRCHYQELQHLKLVDVDIVDDGELLRTIADSSQDFVIANHFIEHCQNPILAVINMLRAIKPGGILYLAIPDMRLTFDSERPVTTLEHVVRDYQEGPECSRTAHFEEYVRLVEKYQGEAEIAKQVKYLMDLDYSIHFHCWTQQEALEMLQYIQPQIRFDIEMMMLNIEEIIFVLRKK